MTISRTSALSRPMLGPEEEAKLLALVRERNDLAAETRIVESYYRVCYSTASNYSKNPEDIKELAQEAYFGLRRAMHKYDPSRGTKFSTYIRDWIRSHIASASSRTMSAISIPPRLYIDAKMGRLDPHKHVDALGAITPSFELDAPLSADETGETAQSRLIDQAPSPEDIAIARSEQTFAVSIVNKAMAMLTERERIVISRRRLAEYPDTLEDIGLDLGVTRERVRQIEVEAMMKLGNYLKAMPGART